jgi:2,3-bisphosphoglycerate-independent phosphoglycerate mutase
LKPFEDYRVMVASDHLTPIVKRTHTGEPTPFAWATKHELETTRRGPPFTEKAALGSGLIIEEGHRLMDRFVFG